MKKNIIREKSFEFALTTMEIVKDLQNKKEYILSKQLLRSGTSVSANVREANNTMTKKDFIYKLNLAQKECDESLYWVELLHQANLINNEVFEHYKIKAEEQLKIIKSNILTSRKNLN